MQKMSTASFINVQWHNWIKILREIAPERNANKPGKKYVTKFMIEMMSYVAL